MKTSWEGFVEYTRNDLSEEHKYAVDNDYCRGIGVLEGYGISVSEWRRGLYAEGQLAVHVLSVSADPRAFSKYTAEFARLIDECGGLRTLDEIEEVLIRGEETLAAQWENLMNHRSRDHLLWNLPANLLPANADMPGCRSAFPRPRASVGSWPDAGVLHMVVA
jgi:hypothetical protein